MKPGMASLGPADWLSLAAAPMFALMAVLSLGDDDLVATCTQAEPPLLSGMAPMYALMAAFHLVPWFRLRTLRS